VEPTPPVLAAGAIVWRESAGRLETLLVHRPRYDDWTFPKGKLDPEECLPVAAVREIAEETGVVVRLGVPLATLEYELRAGGRKRVSYWCARPRQDGELSYEANDEIDDVRWVDVDQTASLLSYDTDRRVLNGFRAEVAAGHHHTEPLIVLRHAKALPRRRWDGDDRKRPLADQGIDEAGRLVPLLAAYGVRQVVSSDARRCLQTVQPYAEAEGLEVLRDDGLSQEDASPARIAKRVPRLLATRTPTVLCTHRPVLPMLFDHFGVDDPSLEPAELMVLHHGGSGVVASEVHSP